MLVRVWISGLLLSRTPWSLAAYPRLALSFRAGSPVSNSPISQWVCWQELSEAAIRYIRFLRSTCRPSQGLKSEKSEIYPRASNLISHAVSAFPERDRVRVDDARKTLSRRALMYRVTRVVLRSTAQHRLGAAMPVGSLAIQS